MDVNKQAKRAEELYKQFIDEGFSSSEISGIAASISARAICGIESSERRHAEALSVIATIALFAGKHHPN